MDNKKLNYKNKKYKIKFQSLKEQIKIINFRALSKIIKIL